MAGYTVLQSEDIEALAQCYGLSVIEYAPIFGGAANSSTLLKTDLQDIVITIFEDKSFEYVSQLEQLLQHLAASRVETTRILRPKKSKQLCTGPFEKPFLVKEFIDGAPSAQLDDHMLSQIGAAMAALHMIAAPDFLPTEHAYGKELFSSVFGQNIDREYEVWLENRTAFLIKSIPPDLPKSLIHGDLFWDNILFADEQFKALIDFEEACYYYRVFDLGMCVLGTCMQDGAIDMAKTVALVRGYAQTITVHALELEHLQLFVEYAAMATSYWRFWKHNIHQPTADKARAHWEMVDCARAANSVPRAAFRAAVTRAALG